MNFVPSYFAKEAGCVLVYMEWTPLQACYWTLGPLACNNLDPEEY